MGRTTKWLCSIGCALLLIMAGFHISGIRYGSRLIEDSNAAEFVKEIFPILFAHPSIHLLGLAALGFVALTMQHDGKKVMLVIGILVLVDGVLALSIGGLVPAVLLITSAVLFIVGSLRRRSVSTRNTQA